MTKLDKITQRIVADSRRSGSKAVLEGLQRALSEPQGDPDPVKVKAMADTAAVLRVILDNWNPLH